MVERWPPLLPVPLVWPPTKVWKWKYGEKGHDTETGQLKKKKKKNTAGGSGKT